MELLFDLPAQRRHPSPRVELREPRIRDWLKQLPLHHPGEAAGLLAQTLSPLVTEPLPAPARWRLLELYRPAVGALLDAVAEPRLRVLPMSRAQRNAQRAQAFAALAALATGYKVVVHAIWHQAGVLREGWVPEALYRALGVMSLALEAAWAAYRTPPAGSWRDFYQVYRCVERLSLTDRAIAEAQDETAGQVFRRMLTLGLADPYHLPEGQLARMKAVLTGAAIAQCRLTAAADHAPAADGVFVVDLSGDGPPRAPAGMEHAPLDLLRHFDTRALGEMAGLDEGVRQWVVPALRLRSRAAVRQTLVRSLPALTGLEILLKFLSPTTLVLAPAEVQTVMIDVDAAGFRGRAGSDPTEMWQLVDEGLRSFRLRRPAGPGRVPRVGEPIGFPAAGGGTGFRLGIVRWLRQHDEGVTEAGVELLSGTPQCVSWRTPSGIERRGVLLPAVAWLGTAPTLLVAEGSLAVGQALELAMEGGETGVYRVATLIEAAAGTVRVALSSEGA